VARNLEIKVHCDEVVLDLVRERVSEQGAVFQSIRQIDTYFAVTRGRLKLREIDAELEPCTAELIAYQRPDRSGSRWSDYQRIPVPLDTSAGLKRALEAACGVAAVVDKQREVAILRRTRVHLDRVAGMGCFVELETVAGDGDDDGDLAREHAEIVAALGLEALQIVAGSYGDLIGQRKGFET
jgi:adenylate cyclase class IV